MGLQQLQQQHHNKQPQKLVVQKPQTAQSVHSQLSETNDLLLERVHSAKQAARQRPARRVTGNPFADPEQFSDDNAESSGFDTAAAQEAALQDGDDTHVHTSAQPQMQVGTLPQQPCQQTALGTMSAWDAISNSARAADSNSIAEEARALFHQLP